MPSMHDDDYFICPHCDEPLPLEATHCPACGSDAETGWSEFADYGGLDLPDEAEDEYEQAAQAAPASRWQQVVVATALLLLLWFVLSMLRAW